MYKKSKISSKIYDLNDNQIVMDDTFQEYLDFVNWLSQGNELVQFDGTQEEINQYNNSLIPQNVRSRQLRLALVYSGFNLDNISNAIDTLEEPNKSIASIEWEYATSFDRYNQLLNSLGQILGLTEQDINDLFTLANTL